MFKRVFMALLAAIVVLFATPVLAFHQSVVADDGIIPGKYIVVLRDDVQDVDGVVGALSRKHGLEREFSYYRAVKGFAARMSAKQAADVAGETSVAFVSPDRAVYAIDKPADKPGGGGGGGTKPQPGQTIPTGIARVEALKSSSRGAGVGVAVIDTGIDLSHPDLKDNIKGNVTFVSGTKNGNDDNGHGTHVAGTIAALNNDKGVVGVAPEASLYAVKVLNRNGSGTWSGVIAGVDWVAQRAGTIRVANMSLGGSGTSDNNCGNTNNDALHKAICGARDKGVTFVVAAGNSAINASSSVPAAYDDAVITASAIADSNGLPGGGGPTTQYGADDTFASFSNFGPAVDIAAPGVNILSTWKGGSYNTISGTSMAAPHVSGAVALYLASSGSTPGLSAVRTALLDKSWAQDSSKGFSGDGDDYPEPLLNAGGF